MVTLLSVFFHFFNPFAMSFPVSSSNSVTPAHGTTAIIRILENQIASGTATDSERDAFKQARSLMSQQQQEELMLAQALAVFSPGLGNTVTYNSAHNVFVGGGYTSNAGNTYFSSLRMSSSIAIKADTGIGHTHTFLNGVQIWTVDGNRQLLKEERFHCQGYSEQLVRIVAVRLMTETILAQVPAHERDMFGVQAKLLANRCVQDAYDCNQVEVLHQNLRRLM